MGVVHSYLASFHGSLGFKPRSGFLAWGSQCDAQQHFLVSTKCFQKLAGAFALLLAVQIKRHLAKQSFCMKCQRVAVRVMHPLAPWHFCGWLHFLWQPFCGCAPYAVSGFPRAWGLLF